MTRLSLGAPAGAHLDVARAHRRIARHGATGMPPIALDMPLPFSYPVRVSELELAGTWRVAR